VKVVDRHKLRSYRHASDLVPRDECLTASAPKPGGGVLVGATGERFRNLIADGNEPLHLPRRLEELSNPLSSSGRLMRILGRRIWSKNPPQLAFWRPLFQSRFEGERTKSGRDCHIRTEVAQPPAACWPAAVND
jgi:hypothetical protein